MNSEQLAAASIRWALKNGIVERPKTCEQCGEWIQSGCQAAHYNYEQKNALVVRWLCATCHKLWDLEVPKPIPAPRMKFIKYRVRSRTIYVPKL